MPDDLLAELDKLDDGRRGVDDGDPVRRLVVA
jgi:hypothetical protein